MRKIGIVCVFVLLFACAGCAAPASTLTVIEPWARPGAAGGSSAVYFSLQNGTAEDDTLLSAASDAAAVVEVHRTMMDEAGTMQMQHQSEGVEIPAGQTVLFEPGGLHIMLMQLNADLQPGDTLAVRLQFAEAGEITVQAEVREP